MERKRILVTGRVQGVGFRPTVHRLAVALELTGFVWNDTRGVTIELQGSEGRIEEFLKRLTSSDRPPLARIESCEVQGLPLRQDESSFVISASRSDGAVLSEVSADTAVCADCLRELVDQGDFRHRYPFINCTNCGPRYSIVKTIPYDRPNTTMSVFPMCERCAGQYRDVTDRRFHAQPVACPRCGPKVWLTDRVGNAMKIDSDEAIAETARLLRQGKILAIKGLGGFHLACDAFDNEAVLELRRRKRRDFKPFALMAASLEEVKKHVVVNAAAEQALTSPESPIVLLPRRADAAIAPAVAQGVDSLGFMLCYAPLHHLLFAEGLDVLVMTSANLSDEPLICRNDLALERLGDVADAFLMHDREIYRQVDDSIVYFVGDERAILRRARGYVPTPILMNDDSPQEILAAGADMKNTFCLAKGNQLILSEHIGDLEDADVYHHYVGSIRHLAGLFEARPSVVACDLHPGYFSTQYAKSLSDVRVIQVQHHWAHIASVLAEHRQRGPVIGIECDGTGYGTDGAIWGCECMIASLTQFTRFGHLAYYPLAGGDKASKEAVRPLLGLLKQAYGSDFELGRFSWLLERIEPDRAKLRLIDEQIDRRLNVVNTSSLGRVFDAVAAMLGLGNFNHFDVQLPMALESVVDPSVGDFYEFALHRMGDRSFQLDLGDLIQGVVEDVYRERPSRIVAAKFHNTLVEALLAMARTAANTTGLEVTALSGGVFCNRFLTARLVAKLNRAGFVVLVNRDVPANDGGLALGQAAIAAAILKEETATHLSLARS
ncbi:MAG TPA: carbamoyltransferase HypF [Sedimentisphaerales bacterium]|nr:carbamoyltransferase HypF [Sedimentisphaerales bacterium]